LEEKAIPPDTGDRMLKLAHTVRKRLGDASAENIKEMLNILDVSVTIYFDPDDRKKVKVWITSSFPIDDFCTELNLSREYLCQNL
jgi:hypothetical protein